MHCARIKQGCQENGVLRGVDRSNSCSEIITIVVTCT